MMFNTYDHTTMIKGGIWVTIVSLNPRQHFHCQWESPSIMVITLYNVCPVHRWGGGGGCSMHRRDTMKTSGGYHEYIGRIPWVHRGMFSTLEGYHDECGEYHDSCGGILWVHRGFNINQRILPISSPTWITISPRCTHGIPPMYWTSPDVLMISPT